MQSRQLWTTAGASLNISGDRHMGIRYRTHSTPDLHNYDPEYNKDGTEKHISCDGARYHVISYHGRDNVVTGESWTELHCSEPNCEMNKRWKAQREGSDG